MSADELIGQIMKKDAEVKETEAALDHLYAERRELVQQALAAGAGAQELAESLGVSRQRVYKIARKEYR